jgi:hypothetical protein
MASVVSDGRKWTMAQGVCPTASLTDATTANRRTEAAQLIDDDAKLALR